MKRTKEQEKASGQSERFLLVSLVVMFLALIVSGVSGVAKVFKTTTATKKSQLNQQVLLAAQPEPSPVKKEDSARKPNMFYSVESMTTDRCVDGVEDVVAQENDYLIKIARKLHISSYLVIADMNGIQPPYTIYPRQALKVPCLSTSARSSVSTLAKVRETKTHSGCRSYDRPKTKRAPSPVPLLTANLLVEPRPALSLPELAENRSAEDVGDITEKQPILQMTIYGGTPAETQKTERTGTLTIGEPSVSVPATAVVYPSVIYLK